MTKKYDKNAKKAAEKRKIEKRGRKMRQRDKTGRLNANNEEEIVFKKNCYPRDFYSRA